MTTAAPPKRLYVAWCPSCRLTYSTVSHYTQLSTVRCPDCGDHIHQEAFGYTRPALTNVTPTDTGMHSKGGGETG